MPSKVTIVRIIELMFCAAGAAPISRQSRKEASAGGRICRTPGIGSGGEEAGFSAFPVELSARGTISAKPGLQAQIYSASYAALRRRSFTWSFTWGRVHEANRAKPPPCRTERDKDGAPGFGWACRSPRLASFARLTWGTLTFSPVSSSCECAEAPLFHVEWRFPGFSAAS